MTGAGGGGPAACREPGVLRLGNAEFPPGRLMVMAIVNRTPDSFYQPGTTWDDKVGGTPWRMPRRDSDLTACYVDVSFYRTADVGELRTAVAQVFNERGDGVVVRGGTATKNRLARS